MALLQLGSRSLSLRAFTLAMCLFATTEVPSGLAQAVGSQGAKKTSTPNIDISLGVFGQLTSTRMPTTNTSDSLGTYTTQAAQGTSPSAGVLGTFHQSFKPWLGYNINLGYSRFSENYSLGQAFIPIKGGPITMPRSEFSRGSIGTNFYETTVAYVVRGPRTKRFGTFAQIGGGGLWFLPIQDPSPYSEQVRLAMVFGTGFNYKLSDHLGVRAEYRGLFYKNPDFRNSNTPIPISKLFTVTNAPAISVVYTFGGGKKKR